MRDPDRVGVTLLWGTGLTGPDGTHRRELVPVGGPENWRRSGLHRDTRKPHLFWGGFAFEARGKRIPQSIEAGPLPEGSRANG